MKLVSIILLIIVAGSTFIPCSDTENDFSEQKEMSIFPDGDHDGHADFDFCSPLCSCHCCHSHITTAILAYTNYYAPSLEFNSYYSDHLLKISFSFWQPPKIA